MTITTLTTHTNYTASGVTTAFATPVYFGASTVEVYLNGVLQSSGYTLVQTVGTQPQPGTVTFSVAPTAGTRIDIEVREPRNQTTTYLDYQSNAVVTESTFDHTVMLSQRLGEARYYAGKTVPKSGAGTITIDTTSAEVFTHTPSGTTTYAFTNPLPSLFETSFRLYLTLTSTVTLSFPAGTVWDGGTTPSFVSGKTYIIQFSSVNAGTTWYARVLFNT